MIDSVDAQIHQNIISCLFSLFSSQL